MPNNDLQNGWRRANSIHHHDWVPQQPVAKIENTENHPSGAKAHFVLGHLRHG
jgi:hypothetical protein